MDTEEESAVSGRGELTEPDRLEWCIDRFEYWGPGMNVQGWAFGTKNPVSKIELILGDQPLGQDMKRLDSADVVLAHGPAAANSRFSITVPNIAHEDVLSVRVRIGRQKGDGLTIGSAELRADYAQKDPLHRLFNSFFALVRARDVRTFLEIGSRARSGNVYRKLIDERVKYIGMDIQPGPNVDIVGDAHRLSALISKRSIDAIFSISTFEHLAMPWKVAIEMNRVMREGAIAFIQTHQTWAVHEAPWDYWRFSSYAWDSLFNSATGFRVIETAMGEPASIVPQLVNESSHGLQDQPAFLGSAVIVEKVSNTRLKWPVDTDAIASTAYPH